MMKAAFKYFFLWLILMIVGVLMFAVPVFVAYFLSGDKSGSNIVSNPWALAIMMLGGDLLSLLVFWYAKYTNFSFNYGYDFGSDFSSKKLYLWAAVGCIGCLLFNLVFDNYVTFPDWETESLESLADLAATPLGIFIICLSGPLVEEAVFRGAIERRLLEKSWNPWFAIVISAIFFALAHGNLSQGTTAIVIGIFMGWVYYCTRSIWPCFFIHALNNTAVCVLGWAVAGTSYEDMVDLPVTASVTMLVASIILVYFAIKMIAQLTKDRTLLAKPVVLPPPLPAEAIGPLEATDEQK